ncbi:hypothetical protein G7Y89_g6716 [Cudoniella acicularis]|uniref:2EXR domain-containing protein n=1 Tax=Cudoniella acicularis TaxID=354080 RepID=A0A8H4RJY9_9HELO|nr:hypothetical protein G7Y89_g6716 [Cudoniella acicularis]
MTKNSRNSRTESKSGKMSAPDTFTLFSNLPAELQLEIWEAAQDPETYLFYGAIDTRRPFNGSIKEPPNPITLSVNSDSRGVAFKNYSLSFTRHRFDGCPIYFNPEKDTLIFSTVFDLFHFLEKASEEDRKKAHFLAFTPAMTDCAIRLPNIQEVTILVTGLGLLLPEEVVLEQLSQETQRHFDETFSPGKAPPLGYDPENGIPALPKFGILSYRNKKGLRYKKDLNGIRQILKERRMTKRPWKQIEMTPNRISQLEKADQRSRQSWKQLMAIPTALSVNFDSRGVALEQYSRSFGIPNDPYQPPNANDGGLYVAPEKGRYGL